MMEDEELLELVELELREAAERPSKASPATTFRSSVGRRWTALECDVGRIRTRPTYKPILELMDAVDAYIPMPVREVDQPFLMPIEDVFGIKGRGTVVTGRVDRGRVKTGDQVEIVGLREGTRTTVVTGVEMFRKTLPEGLAGDNLGCLLRGIDREEVERGQVLAKPGSITPHTTFRSRVYVLKKEEGGRHTPFFQGYRPQFFIRTMDVTGEVVLDEGTEMVMPGRQRGPDGSVDHAGGAGSGFPVCYS